MLAPDKNGFQRHPVRVIASDPRPAVGHKGGVRLYYTRLRVGSATEKSRMCSSVMLWARSRRERGVVSFDRFCAALTFLYVIDLLMRLFAHSRDTAYELTLRIHNTGRAIVYTTHREKAELKRDQVLAYGPDPSMAISKGPLGCYIEPAPTD